MQKFTLGHHSVSNFQWMKFVFLSLGFKTPKKWEKNQLSIGKTQKGNWKDPIVMKYHRCRNFLNSVWWYILVSEKSICLHKATMQICELSKKILSSMKGLFLFFFHSRQKLKWTEECSILEHALHSYYLVPFKSLACNLGWVSKAKWN